MTSSLIRISLGGNVVLANTSSPLPGYTNVLVASSNFQKDTWYWIRITIFNTYIWYQWSIDGKTWNSAGTQSGSNLLNAVSNNSFAYGIYSMVDSSTSDSSKRGGTYDLSECYVVADPNTEDEIYWWKPYLNGVNGWNIIPSSMMSINSFSGIAAENIAVNGSGQVKTVLPE